MQTFVYGKIELKTTKFSTIFSSITYGSQCTRCWYACKVARWIIAIWQHAILNFPQWEKN